MKNFVVRSSLLLILIVFVLTLPFSFYIVGPNEYAALFEFGKIVSIIDTPGIKYRLPAVNTVQHISKKLHLYDIPRSGVITKDKKSMIADNYVTWRVIDPVKYIQTLNAVEARARERIEAAVKSAEAEQKAAVLTAEGEAEYMKILQNAYDTPEKAEFYNFLRSLDALKKSMKGSGEKIIILDKNSLLGKILSNSQEDSLSISAR